MKDDLLTCPHCKQPGFTARGLKSHAGNERCRKMEQERAAAAGLAPVPAVAADPTPTHLATMTGFAVRQKQPPHVTPYDFAEQQDALRAGSIAWVCPVVGRNYDEAVHEAQRAFAEGRGMITEAGRRDGIAFPTLSPRPAATQQPDAGGTVVHKPSAPGSLSRFGGTLEGRDAKGTLVPTSDAPEDEDTLLGVQLEMQWDRAVGGQREQIIFGAMMLKLRERVSPARGDNSPSRGPTAKGKGLDNWLKEHAPKVSSGTAYRLMEIAEGVQEICKLGKTVDMESLLAASAEELPEKLAKKRAKIEKLIEGKSQRQLLLEFSEAKPRGGHRTKGEETPLTPEQEREAILAACRADFTSAAMQLDELVISQRWKAPTITDAELDAAVGVAELFVAQVKAWLKTPQKKRSPLALPEPEESEAGE